MNNNHKPIQYRQGDVFIERISETPQKTIEVSRDGGRVILARGQPRAMNPHRWTWTLLREEGVSA